MKIKITGEWNGEPIWREETAQECLLKAISQNKKSGYCYNQDGLCEEDNCRCK